MQSNHKALPFTGVWVEKNCKRPVSRERLGAVLTSPPTKGQEMGLKLATLHPESEKQDNKNGNRGKTKGFTRQNRKHPTSDQIQAGKPNKAMVPVQVIVLIICNSIQQTQKN